MDYQVYTLPNGIRLLHKPASSQISHACIIVNTGSRDEDPDKSGIAHFIEHLLFKKTAKRSTNQILNCLEVVGADLNAYTTKEYTCIHASFLNPYLSKALDLFEDILFHSVFPEDEIEKEKGIVLDEIASYQDQPEDAINDDFEDLLFKGHPLGRNILGTTDSVKAFGRADILDFIKAKHNTHEIVIGVFGNYIPKKLSSLFSKYFQNIPENNTSHIRKPFDSYSPEYTSLKKAISQTHCIIGNQAYDLHHKHKTGLLLLNNLLGGPGMSSRLNLELREKYGIAYTIESNYTPLSDTGIFSIYFGTDPEKTNQALKIIQRELKKLQQVSLGAVQISQTKQKFIGQIALGEENHMGLIISMAKSLLDYDKVDTLEEVYARINAVTSNQILEIANETFDPAKLTTLIFDAKE